MDMFRWVREGLEWEKAKREERRSQPTYRVRSAESRNAGAFILGAAQDGKRLAELARAKLPK